MWLGHHPHEGLWGTTTELDKVTAWLRLIQAPNTFHCHGTPPCFQELKAGWPAVGVLF